MLTNIGLFLLGSILGSFFWLVAERWPKGESLLTPASHCCSCQRRLAPVDLIPLVSSVSLGFSCRYCQKKFSKMSWLAECWTGLVFVTNFPETLSIPEILPFIWLITALLLAFVDMQYYLLSGKIFFPATGILWGGQFLQAAPFYWSSLFFCSGLFLILLLFYQNSIGTGDLLLILSWSPWLALHELCLLLIIASLSGLVVFALFFLIKKPKKAALKKLELPFIPFLTGGLWLVLISR